MNFGKTKIKTIQPYDVMINWLEKHGTDFILKMNYIYLNKSKFTYILNNFLFSKIVV